MGFRVCLVPATGRPTDLKGVAHFEMRSPLTRSSLPWPACVGESVSTIVSTIMMFSISAMTTMLMISYALIIAPSNIMISSNANVWAMKINTCTGNMVQITFSAPRNV